MASAEDIRIPYRIAKPTDENRNSPNKKDERWQCQSGGGESQDFCQTLNMMSVCACVRACVCARNDDDVLWQEIDRQCDSHKSKNVDTHDLKL